ncbi:MAG: hypothetical protein M1827_001557 [Pycnora praestabilis]|nr:MAG: hypothetical protein M1827_001557 [Pycnora praestabilis]
MSAPQPPTPATTPETADQYATFKHNASLGLIFACPLLILLPPRKLDFYTFTLTTTFLLSANQQVAERSGRGILSHMSFARDLPSEKARDVQERLKRERLLRPQPSGQGMIRQREGDEEGLRDPRDMTGEAKGVGERLWMGGEKEGWRERRKMEEREAVQEGGKGYQGLILDQIWDVWNWGKDNKGESKGKEEEKGRREK